MNRRKGSPRAFRFSERPCEACIPSGPADWTLSPVMTVLSRYVPVARITAWALYTAPSWVTTPVTLPSSVRTFTIMACFSSRFS